MTNYSNSSASVRCDFFKESGKWYTTEAVAWTGSYVNGSPITELASSLIAHLTEKSEDGRMYLRLSEMTVVCLLPCHQFAFPVMFDMANVRSLAAHAYGNNNPWNELIEQYLAREVLFCEFEKKAYHVLRSSMAGFVLLKNPEEDRKWVHAKDCKFPIDFGKPPA
jgi:hypothetical protein